MKGFPEHRSHPPQMGFDPLSKQFVQRPPTGFHGNHRDPLEAHLLADLGIDVAALALGCIKFQQAAIED